MRWAIHARERAPSNSGVRVAGRPPAPHQVVMVVVLTAPPSRGRGHGRGRPAPGAGRHWWSCDHHRRASPPAGWSRCGRDRRRGPAGAGRAAWSPCSPPPGQAPATASASPTTSCWSRSDPPASSTSPAASPSCPRPSTAHHRSRREAHLSACLERELEEELLGRKDLEQVAERSFPHVDPFHADQLAEPTRWLVERRGTDAYRLEYLGFGINIVTGNTRSPA